MKKHFSKMLTLLHSMLKREWAFIAIWTAVLAFTCVAAALAYASMFSSSEELATIAAFLTNPALVAMMGKGYGDTITYGIMFSYSMLIFCAIAVAIMNITLVIKNTRGDEQLGRTEIVCSLCVGRLSNLAATLVFASIVNLVLGLVVGFSLSLSFIESINLKGSLTFGLAIGAVGVFFAALSAVFAQIFSSSSSATGASLALLGAFYVVRAVGDVKAELLSWFSPLGMVLSTKCYYDNNFLPILLLVLLGCALGALSLYLNFVRDMGQGMIKERRKKASHTKFLGSGAALIIRLCIGNIIGWAIGISLIAYLYGSLMGEMEMFIQSSDFIKNALVPPEGHTQVEMLVTMIMSLLAIAVAVPCAGIVLRLASEEKQGRADNLYSKAVCRIKLFLTICGLGAALAVILLFLCSLSFWFGSYMVLDTPIAFSAVTASLFVYLPAILVVEGIAAFFVGVYEQKASAIVYSFIGLAFMLAYLGALLDINKVIAFISPFEHIPQLPIDSIKPFVLVILFIVSLALTALGTYRYRTRDLC